LLLLEVRNLTPIIEQPNRPSYGCVSVIQRKELIRKHLRKHMFRKQLCFSGRNICSTSV